MTSFQRVQLRRAFRVVNGGTPTSEPSNWDGDVPWATPVDLGIFNGRVMRATGRSLTELGLVSGSSTVPSGSLIVSTRAPIGYVAQVQERTAFNQGCRGLVPTGPLDVRYFQYQLLAMTEVLESRGQGSTFQELSSDGLAGSSIFLPSPAEQRAIADYLDRETVRIDGLIDSRSKLVKLLQARVEAVIENSIRRLVKQYGSTPLKYAVERVEVGIVINPSTWYGNEGGVPALRGLNIRSGSIDLADLVHITEEGHELHRKSTLRRGDLVVVRTGQAGAAAVVPPELDGCNCIDLVIVRPSREVVPEFLELVLNSDWTQKHVEEYSVGTIQSHFNVGAMKQVPIPLPPTTHQTRVVEELIAERVAGDELKACLARQIDLLQEHRQALITAAVTGELDVPRVAA